MLDIFGKIAERIIGDAIGAAIGGLVDLVRRPKSNPSPRSRVVIASSAAMAERRMAYARWAESLGFVEDAVRPDVFHGDRRGQRIRFLTGLDGVNARPAELEIERPAPDLESTLVIERLRPLPDDELARSLAPLLEAPEVDSVDITKKLVRLSFVPMMSEDSFLESLDRLLRVLDRGPNTAFRS